MRPKGSGTFLEKRRRRAIWLLKQGKNPLEVARAVKASPSSVYRWYRTYQREGWPGLRSHTPPGRPPKLSPEQKLSLIRLLEKGPRAAGFPTDRWRLWELAELIEKYFGVHYHPSHVWKLLVKTGMAETLYKVHASQRAACAGRQRSQQRANNPTL